jgi:hypothetical protein
MGGRALANAYGRAHIALVEVTAEELAERRESLFQAMMARELG